MSFRERIAGLADAAGALLGRSTYQAPSDDVLGRSSSLDIDSPEIEELRRQRGGQLQRPTQSQVRWYLAEIDSAEYLADNGHMSAAARIMRAVRRDGTVAGVMSTRTDGLVRLPKKFIGDAEVVAALELGHDKARSVFDEMHPPAELALLAGDGIGLGIGIAELVPVEGRDYPVLVRCDPEFLVYRWHENQWYFNSIGGLIPITPGDGRWVLHIPGGRMSPWHQGLWRALGRAFVRKELAARNKDNWEGKLANPARVAVSPTGAGEQQADNWFRAVMAWGINTVFGMRPGYDVKLIESNGIGWQSFNTTIDQANTEMTIAIAGQTVTVDGGAGFQNSDIHKSIRADLIQATADALAHTLNTQTIPAFIASRWGVDAIEKRATCVLWDVTPPKDRNSEATSLVTAANAIDLLSQAVTGAGYSIDIEQLCSRFGIPLVDKNVDGKADRSAASQQRPKLVPATPPALPSSTDKDEPEEVAA